LSLLALFCIPLRPANRAAEDQARIFGIVEASADATIDQLRFTPTPS